MPEEKIGDALPPKVDAPVIKETASVEVPNSSIKEPVTPNPIIPPKTIVSEETNNIPVQPNNIPTNPTPNINTPSEIEKPKINVDADSIIVNENVITDDEFFDDFFGE